ncbi:MAG TPA: amylo-alpha-1,6-glucosidase [Phycisphaerae bacterium]|nr:amylo-alpha-1,6-glucosidase [Phycisphaerae bacterium]
MNPTLSLDSRRCSDLPSSRSLEWIVTNGRGGYASATVNQMLCRRYHGLLVAALEPPVKRFVLLAKLDTTLMVDGLTYELATNDYPEVLAPTGYKLLDSFSLRPYPTWRWRAGDSLIEQTLCMVDGEDTVFVRYRLLQGDRPVSITVRPLCASRHFHHLLHANDAGDPEIVSAGDRIQIVWPQELPDLFLSQNGEFRSRSDWYYNFELACDRARGYDWSQNLFMPGPITATLKKGEADSLIVVASTQPCSWRDHASAFAAAAERDEDLVAQSPDADPLLGALLRATGDFLVRRGEFKTIIAGYPWFEDWGRDTFIALPGLCLVPGRYDEAKQVIRAFAAHLDGGMIPNCFPSYGEPPVYNAVDATLWYVNAIDGYLRYTADWTLVEKELYLVIVNIMESHEKGTRHNIHQDVDGLLFAGEDGVALTWMDACTGERAVTPRTGKAVEICALWYNALRIAASFAERMKDKPRADRWRQSAELAHASFNRRFWRDDVCCLYDVIDVNGEANAVDKSIRPNQLLAISLTHPILDESRRRSVVAVCERDLLTPLGLRTLAPSDPNYRSTYEGNVAARDAAYHQGTVWPWLLGPFVTAYVKSYEGLDSAREKARRFLDGLMFHLEEAGIGSVSEVASGDPPHTPGGCPWQAWSVAEPLRCLCEDILRTHARPPGSSERSRKKPVSAVG